MIVHVNQFERGRAAPSGEALACVLDAVEESGLDSRTLASLRVHLDWIQYRANFRDPVTVRRATERDGQLLALAELAVDLRQAAAHAIRDDVSAALAAIGAEAADDRRVFLDDWAPLRDSIIWRFNRLFWQRLGDWEKATGRGFEHALPSGRSDANHPDAVADAVAEFWTLLRELEKRGQLPAEVFAMEIGVGTGGRAALWLDRFQALDEERGTGYYPRVRFLLCDYSLPTLDRALETVGRHRDAVSMIAMDALNPLKALAFLRYKILYIHLTNVYDNLPTDELVRRDGRLYLVEARAYVSPANAAGIAREFGIAPDALRATVDRVLEVGPDVVEDRARGTTFWRAVWDALRLEERLVALADVAEAPVPPGLHQGHLEALLDAAPDDVRFQLSRGAAESFVNTLPLLHPRGYLQVQDIFVTSMDEYRQGFRGPGKLDGSVVNWVNGALLAAVAARAGYDVHVAPFHYRPGSRTSILYTTQRD
ncbi:MAG: hypothetical protein DMD81_00590 [Candidatus Rokuibacteriota bacterium]|nr:MAG: hypothetical protein DMD81_00590 [Candidatus Rokubacteria bacterium]